MSGQDKDRYNNVYRKTFNRPDLKWQRQRVIDFLKKLQGVEHFPDLIAVDEYAIYMDDCGVKLTDSIPMSVLVSQLADVLVALGENGIRHRDITYDNLLWKDSTLHLVDFGWSLWAGEEETPEPVPQVMQWWMDKTDKEQAMETLEKLGKAREDKKDD